MAQNNSAQTCKAYSRAGKVCDMSDVVTLRIVGRLILEVSNGGNASIFSVKQSTMLDTEGTGVTALFDVG